VQTAELEPDARLNAILQESMKYWRPPRRMKLSEWADEHFYLSAESAAEPGRWVTIPYQRGIMDAFTDPTTTQVSWMKAARVGATKMMGAAIGFYMHQDPCPIMIVQPTIEDAEGYSKEEIAPMLRDCPVLAELAPEAGAKNSSNTLLHKVFPGGSLSMVGANSGRGFRRVSRKVVILDEIDGYPASAGTEGDPVKLAIRRGDYYWDRKVFCASTPGLAGQSRIAELFEAGDQRRYYVPCPHCGAMDFLVFREGNAGHSMKWDKGKPATAWFMCSRGGCVIEHKHKREMIAAGEWRASKPFTGHASFHLWTAYSLSPNATWGQLAAEFLTASDGGPELLKVFVNTWLGETWQDRGDAPEWQRLYQRREAYVIGTVPKGVVFLTAGVDVQRDRLVWEVVGWGANRESWSIDSGVLPGDTSAEPVWRSLDGLLAHKWENAEKLEFGIHKLAIDSGYNTQTVYGWAQRHPMSQVIACKGVATAAVLIGSPTKVELKVNGKKRGRGGSVWPIGVNIGKSELYGQLRQERPTGDGAELEPFPPGYCHFPEYGEDFFKQLTAEQLVPRVKRTGFVALEWQLIAGRENHFLDCRILARAAASLSGLDRLARAAHARSAPTPAPLASSKPPAAPPPPKAPAPQAPPSRAESPRPREDKSSGAWFSGKRDSWLGGRRR
jgi:phage terminase large subunit GpA-like protein